LRPRQIFKKLSFRYINTSAVNGLAIALNGKNLWTLSVAEKTRAFKFNCSSNADTTAHVVLVWVDPAGNPAALKQIVNDLDLIVIADSLQTFGNTQSFPDTSNTVEKAVISCPRGSFITAIVNAGSLVSNVQSFALVANGNVVSEYAQEITPVPAFKSGRFNPILSSKIACPPAGGDRVVKITAPLQLKVTAIFPDLPLPRVDMLSHFGASLSMFLGVPFHSVHLYTLSEMPWIGFSCGAYVCGKRSYDSPCYQVGRIDA
jgi:hypothetical protein